MKFIATMHTSNTRITRTYTELSIVGILYMQVKTFLVYAPFDFDLAIVS